MSICVLVGGWNPAPWVHALKTAMPEETVEAHGEVADPKAVEYALVWSPPAGSLDGYPNLKALFSLGAGVDHLMRYEGLPDIPVARIVDPDLTARMSEWVVGQVLLHHRQHLSYAEQQGARTWKELRQPAAQEVRVGILGLGALGRDSAEILGRLGFDVLGWSRSPKTMSGVSCYHGLDSMNAFLSETDILVCLLPLTTETEDLVNMALLSQLRRDGPLGGPVFINAGRGKIQNEADLAEALRDGTLKGASLDVFEHEPLPENSALWSLPNLVITPHVAAVSSPKALSGLLARQIAQHRESGALEHLVNRERGY